MRNFNGSDQRAPDLRATECRFNRALNPSAQARRRPNTMLTSPLSQATYWPSGALLSGPGGSSEVAERAGSSLDRCVKAEARLGHSSDCLGFERGLAALVPAESARTAAAYRRAAGTEGTACRDRPDPGPGRAVTRSRPLMLLRGPAFVPVPADRRHPHLHATRELFSSDQRRAGAGFASGRAVTNSRSATPISSGESSWIKWIPRTTESR